MNYEIIPTLGPATRSVEVWQSMWEAGASGFRLNTSHLTLTELADWLERYLVFQAGIEALLPLTLDLQGSKWRLGRFDAFALAEGQSVALIQAEESRQSGCLPVPHADFFRALGESSGEVVLNDAKISLMVEQVRENSVIARVMQGGIISARKGITLAETAFRAERLSEKDLAIFALSSGIERVNFAVSYVRDASEMAHYRRQMPAPAQLIAKLERSTAVEQAAQIAARCNALWLCRGDLGAEIGLAGMAAAAALISNQAKTLGKPLYLAGQVLEHMVAAPTPTRSEVCCIHDALEAGFRGLVLSDETAVGQYPIEAVRAAAMFNSLGG